MLYFCCILEVGFAVLVRFFLQLEKWREEDEDGTIRRYFARRTI